MRYQIGVIGATGYIGTPYRKEIREAGCDASIVALCARRRDRLEIAAKEDGARVITDDWRAVVEDSHVNLVLVLSPDALHFEPVMACAELGKHVVCEKPIGKNVDQANAMWQAAESAKIASFVPYWTRYVPIFERAKQIVREGLLGRVRSVIYRWHNPRPTGMPFTWRDDAELSSGGAIADVGSHAYDTLRFILGDEAQRVLTHAHVVMPPKPDVGDIDLAEAIAIGEQSGGSVGERRRKGDVPDYAQIALVFQSGAVGSILLSHASYLRKGFAPELELHGEQASLSVDRLRGQLLYADSPEPARMLEEVADDGFCNRFQKHVFPALDRDIRGEDPAHPTLYDGLRVQLFTDAALKSAQEQRWVELGELEHVV